MVYAFLLHTLSDGPCRLLFSSIFTQERPSEADSNDDLREDTKEQLLQVANRVQSEFSFQYVAAGTVTSQENLSLATTDELLSQLESGVFRLTAGNPFHSEKIVVWKGLANCGCTLICEKTENRQIAENVLTIIIKYLQEYCRILLQPAEAILKPDKVTAILFQFLPNGQLLFMNHRFVRELEKQLEQLMAMK